MNGYPIEKDDSPLIIQRDPNGFYLGLRRDMEDRRTLQYGQCRKPMLGEVDISKLPTSMGVAEWMNIENQSSVGACQGHAQSSCLELAYKHQTGDIVQLNRMFAYLASQKVDGITGDNGSTMTGGAKSASTNGIPREESWPYPGFYPRGGWKAIPDKLWTEAKGIVLGGYRILESYEEVLQWLANGVGGVAIGIDWNNSVEPDSQGRVQRYSRGGGGHALALLDWNKQFTDPQGRPYLDMFNSWDRTWGYRGRAFILPAVVDYWAKNMDVIGYGLIQGDGVKPKKFDWIKQKFGV
jgi:hypothetical protein